MVQANHYWETLSREHPVAREIAIKLLLKFNLNNVEETESMPSGKKRKRAKMSTHKRKKRLRKDRHKKKVR